MPPYFDLFGENVAELIPCRRHTSSHQLPVSDHLRYDLFVRESLLHLSVGLGGYKSGGFGEPGRGKICATSLYQTPLVW
jgi:hypothetical protein